MTPASLNECHVAVLKVRDGAANKVWWRHEVGVEYGDELAGGWGETLGKRTGPVTSALGPLHVGGVGAQTRCPCNSFGNDPWRLISRIVEDLDLQAVSGIIERARRLDYPLADIQLVIDR
jgi:hypothetical protein